MPALTVRSVEGEVAVRTQKPAPARRPDWYSPYEAEKGRGGGRQERYKETTILKSDLDTDTERRAKSEERTNQRTSFRTRCRAVGGLWGAHEIAASLAYNRQAGSGETGGRKSSARTPLSHRVRGTGQPHQQSRNRAPTSRWSLVRENTLVILVVGNALPPRFRFRSDYPGVAIPPGWRKPPFRYNGNYAVPAIPGSARAGEARERTRHDGQTLNKCRTRPAA